MLRPPRLFPEPQTLYPDIYSGDLRSVGLMALMVDSHMTTTQQPSTKQDILHYLLKQGRATAQELAEQFQVTPQAIRRHLKDLATEGLILHQVVQTGMGRPNHLYELSPSGRSQFPDRYDDFAVSLLGTLADTVGQDQVSSILRKQWERKAIDYRTTLGEGTLSDRVQKLMELRRAEGYMAECHPVPDAATPQFMLTEYHCAISNIAASFPSICGHELEMFAIALPDCQVERTHWLVDGEHRCGYLIQAKSKEEI
jgi:DeoR family transcriptional regulator, suf operon transcriptional repressor